MRYYLLPLLLLVFLPATGYCQAGSASSKLTIRKIVVEGNHVTRRSVMLREINMHEGDVIEKDSLNAIVALNHQRLFNLQLFNEIEQHTEISDSGIDWYIKVKERWFIIPTLTIQFADRNFNTWWVKEDHDLRRAMVGLTVTDKNFRGNLEQLAVTVQAGYTQKVGISYMRPYVNRGQTSGLGVSFSISQSRQAYYMTDSNKLKFVGLYTGPVILKQAEGGISYIHRPAYASRHIFQAMYKQYTVSDTIVKQNPEYYADKKNEAKFVELTYRYEYNGVDNWNYSLKGFKLVSQVVARAGFEGINFQSYALVEAGLFRQLRRKWYGDAIFRGRLMLPEEQPYYFRGGLGTQTDYVRGYEYYIIDGSHYGLLRLDLKREIFNKTYKLPVKYFTAVPIRIYPKIFADVGYINGWPTGRNYLGSTLLYSAGIGLDIVTSYEVKIRLEFAWNHLSQNGLYLHFNSE